MSIVGELARTNIAQFENRFCLGFRPCKMTNANDFERRRNYSKLEMPIVAQGNRLSCPVEPSDLRFALRNTGKNQEFLMTAWINKTATLAVITGWTEKRFQSVATARRDSHQKQGRIVFNRGCFALYSRKRLKSWLMRSHCSAQESLRDDL